MTNIKNDRLKFTLEAQAENSAARACSFTTIHNEVKTPIFMPVATLAVLRSQDTESVESLGFGVLLANTYHLLLRPGTDVFEKFGGIHSFMNWNKSILTDSGGYQIFSLSKDVKISEDGAYFKSYIDGKTFLLSPETSIKTQGSIGSDIMMVLDQCVPSMSNEKICREAVDITARWAERSLDARGDSTQSLFGIVQGACIPNLREISAKQITSMNFDGFAIGGLAVGESEQRRREITAYTASLLPKNHPRYLMGVGTPFDLLESVHCGVDMFDCILPTAMGQQGVAFTSHGRIELRRGVHKFSERPLDENCQCPACKRYSRAYLHHLIKSKEYYGSNLVGLHNLTFYRNLMNSIRNHIIDGTFLEFYNEQREVLNRKDDDNPIIHPIQKKKRNTMNLGNYEIVQQDKGFYSIKHQESGEIMHSVTEPLAEARTLYVDQAKLEHISMAPVDDDVVIWDVGLGAGTNVMATIMEYERICSKKIPPRGLKIVSFEKDLDSLRLAVKNPSLFKHIRHSAPSSILENGKWSSKLFPIEWILMEGDFLNNIKFASEPDCIFYDPFSLNTDGPMWSFSVFQQIYSHCHDQKTRLFTYSASTSVRASLLAAGFYVGLGAGSGPKLNTTVAFSSIEEGTHGIQLLGKEWLDRYNNSTVRNSAHVLPEEKDFIESQVLGHSQFLIN